MVCMWVEEVCLMTDPCCYLVWLGLWFFVMVFAA